MPNSKTDKQGFATRNADEERDIAGKGGPAIGLGSPTDKHGIAAPYDEDLATQMAAKGNKKPEKKSVPKTAGKHH